LITQIVPNQILEETKHTIKKLANNDLILKLLKCGFKKESNLVKDCGNTRVFFITTTSNNTRSKKKIKKSRFL
jgi:hypothetical protein